MRKFLCVFCFIFSSFISSGYVIVVEKENDLEKIDKQLPYYVIVANSQDQLDNLFITYGVRPGLFPCVIDPLNRIVVECIDNESISNTINRLKLQIQDLKSDEQRTYENAFYALTEQLFNLTGVTNEVTPKLGFPELQAKIEQVQATDPMTAVNLSLKLLSIDAALKRYNVLWWDDAIQHELPEE